MADDAVSSGEMRWNTSQTDPIDAVLSGDPADPGDEDLLHVANVVHDIRSAYLPAEPLRRRAALAAFTQSRPEAAVDPTAPTGDQAAATPAEASVGEASNAGPDGRKRPKMLSTISGFVGTVAGKAVLGTAVAAASVGGLHAADVVDVPTLPDSDPAAVERPSANDSRGDTGAPTDTASEGQQTAADKQAAAQAHAAAVREWTDCVADAAAAQGDAETRVTGGFDPREACGEQPRPQDYGLTALPSQAADVARSAVEGTPGAAASDRPGAQAPAAGSAASPDANTPASPPAAQPDDVRGDARSNAPAADGTSSPASTLPASPPTSDTPAAGRP